ncbi:GGDEF domain-containing protein [Lonsdalea populi]|nr:sensor domain-containing diguanylate cyclase [Lonsdalea populi]
MWAMVSVALLYNPDGSQHGLLLAITDISNQKASETALLTLSKELEQRVEQRTEELQRSHQFIQDITDHIPAMISCISPENIFTFANHHLKVLLGSQGNEPINSHLSTVLRAKERQLFMPLLDKVRKTRHPVHIEHTVDLPPGVHTTYHTQMVPAEPPAQGVYVFSTDITDLTSLRDQLKFEANHDHLTGLPNRRAVISYLNQLAMKPRQSGLALLFFDLDNFKHYNDHYGHEFGDRVIKTFAHILGQNTRPNDLIGRLSGDEFVMVLHERKDMAGEVEEICRTLKERIEKPTRIHSHDIVLTASVGIALLGKYDRLDVNHFIHEADTAMYQAKRQSTHSSRDPKREIEGDNK